ncbi:hypothetical protein SAMN02745217_01220 [Anaerocolumna xylanovorans DSM 12503]|uniref:Uncharacterized protein n=1 Tax=Anaerocolumna xylanovorans DSM 12503 TaxID=1121345 RepID=A0A1M7Y2I1_9FIRM|nr:hypothetical protein SAMN02745217_01220 [Anaerocolumna xylanovorans DSM 12503]
MPSLFMSDRRTGKLIVDKENYLYNNHIINEIISRQCKTLIRNYYRYMQAMVERYRNIKFKI